MCCAAPMVVSFYPIASWPDIPAASRSVPGSIDQAGWHHRASRPISRRAGALARPRSRREGLLRGPLRDDDPDRGSQTFALRSRQHDTPYSIQDTGSGRRNTEHGIQRELLWSALGYLSRTKPRDEQSTLQHLIMQLLHFRPTRMLSGSRVYSGSSYRPCHRGSVRPGA